MKEWQASDISNPIPLRFNLIEFKADCGDWINFVVVPTENRIVFGGECNVGFLESGYIEREEGETLKDTLSELVVELETYYNEGREYVSRIVCNDRM